MNYQNIAITSKHTCFSLDDFGISGLDLFYEGEVDRGGFTLLLAILGLSLIGISAGFFSSYSPGLGTFFLIFGLILLIVWTI